MRGLSLLDLLVIIAVLALLVFAGTREFHRYEGHGAAPAPTPNAALP